MVKRIKTFGDVILSNLPRVTSSAGASSMIFTPDSQKLILSSYGSPCTLVIELPPSTDLKSTAPLVLRSFSHSLLSSGSLTGVIEVPTLGENEDVEMERLGDHRLFKADTVDSCALDLAVSRDAQWLAFSDSTRRINVFNLDTLQVIDTSDRLLYSPAY